MVKEILKGMKNIKFKLLEVCKKVLSEKIDNLKSVVDEAQKSANEYGQPKDRYDSYRTQLLRKRDMFAKQYDKALEQLVILQRINPDIEYNTVQFGSVVYTKNKKLFISISLGEVPFEDDIFFAISPNVPFYKAIKGLKIGDTFEFRGVKDEILNVF
ncbi:MAG: hypothetical protein J7J86_01310 [Bacteroidales bacterium]|nr:hypothetical protein [Bacteroidales bacterium]